ncbi:MAG: hypothetical protein Tsb009_31020 [Planctomycetaceae bacterium]
MNCQQTLQQLEAVRPDSDDGILDELRSATTHLAECPQCRKTFEWRQQVDRKISDVMLDVPIPSGLKSRLLESLNLDVEQQASDDSASNAVPQSSSPKSKATPARSLGLRIAAALTISAAILAGLFFLFPKQVKQSPFTLADVRSSANLQWDQLSEFDQNFTPTLPRGLWQRSSRISIKKHPKGDLKSPEGKHRAASFVFQVSSERGDVFRGVLLVIPRRVLDDAPTRSQFTTESEKGIYIQRSYGSFHTVSWTEGEHTFVCFMPVGDDGLETLNRALYPPAA